MDGGRQLVAYNPSRLFQGQLAASDTTIFTASGNGCIVKEIVVCNTTTGTITLNLSIVPNGNVVGVANRLLFGVSVTAGQTLFIDISQVMASGDFISASASAATSLTATISGVLL